MPKFRKGDVVSVRGVVEYDFSPTDDKMLFIKVPGYHSNFAIGVNELEAAGVKVEQQKFAEMDRVRWSDARHSGAGTILAISDGHAWIDMGGGDYAIRLLTAIERDETEEGADAIAS